MNLILVVSIAVRVAALVVALHLWRDVRDRRMLWLAGVVGLMILRQSLTLFAGPHAAGIQLWGPESWIELPGLAVSVFAFLTAFHLRRFIGESKAREDRLRRAETMQAVGRLASGIAHDFNNILTAVRGFCDRLGRRIESEGTPDPDLSQIRAAGERGSRLVEQLTSLSRGEPENPCRLDLAALLADMEPLIRAVLGPTRRLDLRAEDRDCHVFADPVQMQRVVLNLAGRARYSIRSAGRLEVTTGRAAIDEERARLEGVRAGSYVLLTLRELDTEISAEDTVHLFEPFFAPEGGGRGEGLGLAVIYAVVTRNGGHIAVTSDPARGTTFEVYFPYVSPEDAEAYAVLRDRRARG